MSEFDAKMEPITGKKRNAGTSSEASKSKKNKMYSLSQFEDQGRGLIYPYYSHPC